MAPQKTYTDIELAQAFNAGKYDNFVGMMRGIPESELKSKKSESADALKANEALQSKVADFLHEQKDLLDPEQVGDFLGGDNNPVLSKYTEKFDFKVTNFIPALRSYLSTFRLPGEGQKIPRVMDAFGKRYVENNPNLGLSGVSASQSLASMSMLIFTDMYNPNVKRHMTFDEFKGYVKGENNADTDGKPGKDRQDYPESLLNTLWTDIANGGPIPVPTPPKVPKFVLTIPIKKQHIDVVCKDLGEGYEIGGWQDVKKAKPPQTNLIIKKAGKELCRIEKCHSKDNKQRWLQVVPAYDGGGIPTKEGLELANKLTAKFREKVQVAEIKYEGHSAQVREVMSGKNLLPSSYQIEDKLTQASEASKSAIEASQKPENKRDSAQQLQEDDFVLPPPLATEKNSINRRAFSIPSRPTTNAGIDTSNLNPNAARLKFAKVLGAEILSSNKRSYESALAADAIFGSTKRRGNIKPTRASQMDR